MKKFIAIFALALSIGAQAGSVDIFETPYYMGYPRVNTEFQANKDLGRAWVSINIDTSTGDSDLGNDWYRQKVEGLSYDAATDSIVLDIEGKIIQCARFDRGGIFRSRGFKNTDCKITSRLEKRVVDDGFEISKQDVVVLTLNYVE